MSDVRAAARRWAATWQRGWEALDADPIVALYAEDTRFSSQPFRTVDPGRAGVRRYVEGAFAEESDVVARFGEPIVDGRRAAVSWWAELVDSGEEVTMAGTSVLAFDDEGRVVEQWDTWNVDQGRRPPSASRGLDSVGGDRPAPVARRRHSFPLRNSRRTSPRCRAKHRRALPRKQRPPKRSGVARTLVAPLETMDAGCAHGNSAGCHQPDGRLRQTSCHTIAA